MTGTSLKSTDPGIYYLQTRNYLFSADSMGLSSFAFTQRAPGKDICCKMMRCGRLRSFKVIEIGVIPKPVSLPWTNCLAFIVISLNCISLSHLSCCKLLADHACSICVTLHLSGLKASGRCSDNSTSHAVVNFIFRFLCSGPKFYVSSKHYYATFDLFQQSCTSRPLSEIVTAVLILGEHRQTRLSSWSSFH